MSYNVGIVLYDQLHDHYYNRDIYSSISILKTILCEYIPVTIAVKTFDSYAEFTLVKKLETAKPRTTKAESIKPGSDNAGICT